MLTLLRARTSFLILLLTSLAFFSCSPKSTPGPAETAEDRSLEITVPAPLALTPASGQELPSSLPSTPLSSTPDPQETLPSPAPALPIPQYILTATLDYGRHHLVVEEQIVYTNRAQEPLPDLLLMVEPIYYPGVFQLKDLSYNGGHSLDETAWDGTWLRVNLPQPLAAGEKIDLELTYELNLPSPVPSPTTRPVPFGYTARQTNLVDWYPFIPPYQAGQGWQAHRAGYFGEHLVYEAADFDVNIRLADARPELTVAASAPAEVDGEWRRYRLESARNFAWSVSHDYQVLTEIIGEVTVIGYAFPAHPQAGEAALRTTAQALALYSDLFGPYPHKSLTVVEADFLDGMEYDGLYFLSYGFYNTYQGSPGAYLISIAAHETAHQWWYGLVGNDQAMEPWLDEALCTYSERIFYENKYPEALDWWWAYRVNYYTPRGAIDGSIYDFGGNLEPYRSYRDATYLNGAVFLEELRTLVGDEVFFTFLNEYVRQNTHQVATTKRFFDLLDQNTQADWTPLVDKYFTKNNSGN